MKFTACVAVASLLTCGAAPTAQAADVPASAPVAPPTASQTPKEHYDRAMIFYTVQDWPGATRELTAACEGDPRPEYLYALAQAQRLSGDCASAIVAYRAFVRGASGSAAVAAEGFIHVCEAKVKQESAATLKVQQAETAVRAPVQPPAETDARVHPAPLTVAKWYADPLGDTLAGAGAAGIASGIAFLMLYRSNVSTADTAATDKAYQADWSTANVRAVMSGVAGGVGVIALGAAIWRWTVVGSGTPDHVNLPSVGFSATMDGFQLSYGSRF